jgi:hypothetical protein
MFDVGRAGVVAGRVEGVAGWVACVDVAAGGLFAEAADVPEPFFPEAAAEPMAASTINARMTVRIGCRRNQLLLRWAD